MTPIDVLVGIRKMTVFIGQHRQSLILFSHLFSDITTFHKAIFDNRNAL